MEPVSQSSYPNAADLKKFLIESQSDLEKSQPKKAPPFGSYPVPLFVCSGMGAVLPSNQYDEVYPGILLGDCNLAKDMDRLRENGVTHILNSAQGPKFNQVDTNAEYYEDANITYMGIPAMDIAGYKLKAHFSSAAEFIDNARNSGGKVYVHCHQGLSRSATLVLAFLMLKEKMVLFDAAKTVRTRRPILPNDGFLKQLCELNKELHPETITPSTKSS